MFTRLSFVLLVACTVAECVLSDAAFTPSEAYNSLTALVPKPLAHVLTVEEQLIKESTAQGLPPHIALHVAWEESRFQEHMVSKTQDYGVMQLNRHFYPTAAEMTTEQNIKEGVALLAKYWKQTHNERLTARAYRYGPRALHDA